jgi:hypothetical protein
MVGPVSGKTDNWNRGWNPANHPPKKIQTYKLNWNVDGGKTDTGIVYTYAD